MKKLIASSLLVVLACGGAQDESTTTPVAPTGPTEDTAPTGTEGTPTAEAPAEATPMTMEERIAHHDKCFQLWVKEDPTLFDHCYSEESSESFVDGDPPAEGPAKIKEHNQPFYAGFALQGETVMNVASGDSLVTLGILIGTHDGDFMGAPASNKQFGGYFAEVQQLDEKGRHGKVTVYYNMADMMAQLGMAKGMKGRPVPTLTGSPSSTVIAADSDAERANVATVQAGFEAFNKRDWKGLAADFAPDATWQTLMAPANQTGSKNVMGFMKTMGKAFSKGTQTVDNIWGAGDWVVAETTFAGDNDGPLKDLGIKKATKKSVSIHELHMFRLEGGKVKEMWSFGNGMAMANQLGMIPAPAAAAAPAK